MLEFLVILVGFIALLFALNARKRAMLLQLEVTSHLARISRLEDDLEALRQRRPEAPRPEAPAVAPQVPETPPAIVPAPTPEAEALRPPEEAENPHR